MNVVNASNESVWTITTDSGAKPTAIRGFAGRRKAFVVFA